MDSLYKMVMEEYGFHDTKIIEQLHKDTERLIYLVEADGKKFLLRGLPDSVSEDKILDNTRAHIYLGNQKEMAPKLINTLDWQRHLWTDIMMGKSRTEGNMISYSMGQSICTFLICRHMVPMLLIHYGKS